MARLVRTVRSICEARKAGESAANWLLTKAHAKKKLNPVPYALFASIVSKQVKWAAQFRDIKLDFDEVAEVVENVLRENGVSVQVSETKSRMDYTQGEDDDEEEVSESESNEAITVTADECEIFTGGAVPIECEKAAYWFANLMSLAIAGKHKKVILTARLE